MVMEKVDKDSIGTLNELPKLNINKNDPSKLSPFGLKIDNKKSVNNIESSIIPSVETNIEDEIILRDNSKNGLTNVIGSFHFRLSDINVNKKFIKSCESLFRRSKEYSDYIQYLTEKQKLTMDVLNNNIDSETIAGITLEFHHYPYSLYDVTEIIVNKNINDKKPFTSFDIVNELIKVHYLNLVGLARLSKTNHQLVHAGKLFVPLSSVFGRVNEFNSIYKEYMYKDQIDKYNSLIEADDYYNDKLNNSLTLD